jgi:putative ABC transport system permease protein
MRHAVATQLRGFYWVGMYLTYVRRELRRRSKQAIVVAIGLAIGIGLVITVSSASAGVKSAQVQVLHSLDGVGTDMTVTKTASAGSGGPQRFSGFGGGSGSAPAAGTQISRNTLRPTPGSTTLSADDVSKVASLRGAAAATGGLVLTDTSFSGTIPSTGSGAASGGSSSAGASFDVSSFSVDGVQISKSGVGPLVPSEVSKGSYFSSSDNTALVAIVNSSYATQQRLGVGSKITVAGDSLTVIGVAEMPSGSSDVYVPLGTAQNLSGLGGKVTTIYVSASKSSNVSTLASEVRKAVPGATVSTSAQLASEVTGSLSSATSLATRLGKWLSISALAVAFLVAGLLMMAAVSRRVREFGTLKAIGWRTRRIVAQVMGEGLALGVVGGVAGIALGLGGSAIVSAVSPSLTATVGSPFATGGGFGGGGSGGGSSSSSSHSGFAHALDTARTVLVHMSAPVQGDTIVAAVCLAVAGGLIAGALGSWRAARLRPAAALRRVE